jgi:hypothetical protein
MIRNVCYISVIIVISICSVDYVYSGCNMDEDCVFHQWLPLHDCTCPCGDQTRLRQRVFCCPHTVPVKTPRSCLEACSLPSAGNEFDEYIPCLLCHHGTLSSENSSVCHPKYKGPCCDGTVTRLMFSSIILNRLFNQLTTHDQLHVY